MKTQQSTHPIHESKASFFRNKASSLLQLLALFASLAFSGSQAFATNILLSPGFEQTPIFSFWTAQTTEGWSMNNAGVVSAGNLFRTGANALWMQGVYLQGGAQPYYNMGAVQTFACSPGSTYSADAWFSQFMSGPLGIGGSDGASTLFESDAAGVQDGWVEVQFLDASSSILADYKSAILSPLTVTQPGSVGVQTICVNNLPTTTATIPGCRHRLPTPL